jgi:hypothetical protein
VGHAHTTTGEWWFAEVWQDRWVPVDHEATRAEIIELRDAPGGLDGIKTRSTAELIGLVEGVVLWRAT